MLRHGIRNLIGNVWRLNSDIFDAPTICSVRIHTDLRYDGGMLIPHGKLPHTTLRAVVEEYVTRDGTDHSSVDTRIESVLRQLVSGQAELHFDLQSATTNIVEVGNGTSSQR